MAAESTYVYDEDLTDVFDTGDPRSFLDHLALAERARTAAFEELISPFHAIWRIGSALLGMARKHHELGEGPGRTAASAGVIDSGARSPR